MKLGEMKTNAEVIAEDLANDPAFRAEWERTALARAVAIAIVRYRAEHDLSQRQLAEAVGMSQPQVARLELGEYNPRMETLLRLSSRLGLEFTIDVRPVGKPARRGAAGASSDRVVETVAVGESEILVSAGAA